MKTRDSHRSTDLAGPDRKALLEALSDRVLRHMGVSMWRQVFLGLPDDAIRFERERLTFVALDGPAWPVTADEARLLATRLGARVEPSLKARLVLACPDAGAALKAAVLLHRKCHTNQTRSALSTADCDVACLELAGLPMRLAVGRAIQSAEYAVRKAAAGSVVICGDTFAAIGDDVFDQVSEGLVSVESTDQTVTQASITLSPCARARSAVDALTIG